MTLLDFLKRDKLENENKFIGRYQSVLKIRHILGENVPTMEMQIAINKDLGERNEILEKLERLEKNIHSESFDNQISVYNAGLEIEEIIGEGYTTCVFQIDRELENRCLAIRHDTVEYMVNFMRKNGTLKDDTIANLDKALELHILSGFLCWMTLGDKLKTRDEQDAWMIMSSILYPKKLTGNIKDLVVWALKDKEHDANEDVIEPLRKMKKRLLESKKINEAAGKIIDKLIDQGITESKQNHK